MLVMFGQPATLILAIIEKDVEKIKAGLTLEYIDPPHDPQLVRNIVVMYGATKEDVIRQVKAAGVEVSEPLLERYRADGRTDRPFKPH